MRKWIHWYIVLLWIFATSLSAESFSKQTKNILVLLSYNISIPWEHEFTHGLQNSIQDKELHYELYYEVIDTERLGKYYTDDILARHLKEKYKTISFDSIIAESDRASQFLNKYHGLFGDNIPEVYYLSKQESIEKKHNRFILSDNIEQIAVKTAQMALNHNSNLKDVYVVNGNNVESEFLLQRINKFFEQYKEIRVHIVEKFTLDELLDKIGKVHQNSAILYTLVFKDATNKEYVPKDILEKICKVAKVPVYSMYSTLLGSGTIGGHMMDSYQVASTLIEVLNEYFSQGSFDRDKKYSFSHSYIDHQVFERYDLKTSNIGKNTYLLNQRPSLWRFYRDELIFITIIILLVIIFFIYLLNKKNRQRYLNETLTSELLKEQQKEIETIKNRFQNMFLKHDAVMLLINPDDGSIIDVNKSATRFYGFTRKEFQKMKVSDLNVLTSTELQKKMDEAKELKHNYFEFPHRLKNGDIKIVEVHSSPIEVDDKVILFSIIKDITKVKEYETNLKNTNIQLQELSKELGTEKTKYQNFMENSSDGILIVTLDGALVEYSHVAKNYLGYSDEEMKKLYVFDWDKQITPKEFTEIIKAIGYDNPIVFERIHTRKDGTTYNAAISAIKIDLDGKQFVYASIRDVTKNKILQKELELQKQEFETIFNYAEDGITIIDLEGNFLKFNNAFLKLTDYTKEELLTKNCSELTVAEDREKNQHAMETAKRTGHVENFEKACIVNNGKRINVHVSISLLPDKKSLLLIVKDTSSLKLLEEQAKLASMGEMIGNIAHQWRQPLSIITSSASGLKVQVEYGLEVTPKHIGEFSDLIVQQAQYLSNTIDNFRDFLKGDQNYENIKVNRVIEYTLSLVSASTKNNNISVIKDVDENIMINGSLNELSEAFINIINNSKDVLKEKVENEQDRYIFITASREAQEIELYFKDSGGGISKKYIDRIFEPYFTSKHQSIGTGLGLSMAEKIIRERHNGTISAYNEEYEYNGKEYKGACFKIVLPAI